MKDFFGYNLRKPVVLLCVLLLLISLAGCRGKADISSYEAEQITISGLKDADFTVTPNELSSLKCVDKSDTGQTAKAGTVSVRGPTLNTFLAQYGKKQTDFERIRFIASDQYHVVLRQADLAKYEIVLGISSGSDPLPESERPLRILIPGGESSTWEYACTRIEFVPKDKEETQTVTDSAGRTVTLPKEISRIAPSGAYAQIFLYTLCPDKVIGLSTPYSNIQKQYIDKKYWSLPVFGQFYGKNATMNYESIIKAKPDVIIDIGEEKPNIAYDMDGLQNQTGIPVIFIKATMRSMADAYDELGKILGMTDRASELSSYIRNTLSFADTCTEKIPKEKRARVLYGSGEYGLAVMGQGSIHAEVLDAAGAENVAILAHISDSGGDIVSMEQIFSWAPDVVILAPDGSYDDVMQDASWKNVPAVQNGCVYEIPMGPYSWLDRPPSVQRILGVLWLGNLLYPDLYHFDMLQKTQEFYKLFWRYDLSEEAARSLLTNSTFKEGNAS